MFKIKNKQAIVNFVLATVALVCLTAVVATPKQAPVVAQSQSVGVYEGLTVLTEDILPADDQATIIVRSQEKGVVGELIRLDVSSSIAESFKWLLVPETVDFEVYNEGKRAVFSAREPGKYMFVVACAFEGTVDVTTHVVTIEGDKPAPVDPVDNEVPVVANPGVDAPLAKRVAYWCSMNERSKKETLQLAGSFDSVAAMVSAGVYTTPEEIIQATGDANKEALGASLQDWIPVLRKLQTEFQQMAADGELVTVEQHAETWRDVARSLKSYASLFKTND